MAGKMPEWFFEDDGGFIPMSEWEVEACERKFAERKHLLVYWWPFVNDGVVTKIRYEVDIHVMVQTNTQTNFQRRLIRLPQVNSHIITSPYLNEKFMIEQGGLHSNSVRQTKFFGGWGGLPAPPDPPWIYVGGAPAPPHTPPHFLFVLRPPWKMDLMHA